MRRWSAGMEFGASGLQFRTVRGAKAPDDLRLDVRTRDGWQPVKMELAFALVDFFAENEDYLRNHRSYWKENGQAYFMAACWSAIREGWDVPAARIERQRPQ